MKFDHHQYRILHAASLCMCACNYRIIPNRRAVRGRKTLGCACILFYFCKGCLPKQLRYSENRKCAKNARNDDDPFLDDCWLKFCYYFFNLSDKNKGNDRFQKICVASSLISIDNTSLKQMTRPNRHQYTPSLPISASGGSLQHVRKRGVRVYKVVRFYKGLYGRWLKFL